MQTLGSDICFVNINFTGSLLAFAIQSTGNQATIVLPSTLNWKFEPEITAYYPVSVNQFLTSYSNIRFIEKLSALFPNLVYPVRILTFNSLEKIKAKTIEAFDILLKRDRDHASLPLNPANFEHLKHLTENLHSGALAFEHRFDRNMATIELIKLCKQKGARIICEDEYKRSESDANKTIFCQSNDYKSNEIIIKSFDTNFKNDLRIISDKIEIQIQKNCNDTIFRFNSNNRTNIQNLREHCTLILNSIGIQNIAPIMTEFGHINLSKTENKITDQQNNNVLEDLPISFLPTNYPLIEKQVSKLIGKKIDLKKPLNRLKNAKVTASSFRQYQNECDEKFDLAKQTGVSYQRFQYLFYRYYNEIDNFIEKAYEQMNKTRDAEFIWQKIEEEYQTSIIQELLS